MLFRIKLFIFLIILMGSTQKIAAEVIASDETNWTDPNTYVVQSVDAHDFTINNEIYDPKTFCDVVAGDRMKFVEDNPADCVDAKLFNLRTSKVCDVWCE